MKVLVTGGAGYIGSHTAVELLRQGHEAVIADNLYNAKIGVIKRIAEAAGKEAAFYNIDVCDENAVFELFSRHKFDAVIHFAGYKAVGESCEKPLMYYKNNIISVICVLEAMKKYGCKTIIFSSSATVYGENNPYPYVENMSALDAANPYGRTKVAVEQIIRDCAAADSSLSAVLLRYFNPIGGDYTGLLGDDPEGIPNNIMPYICRVAAGKLEKLTVFGGDYDTPDGTCIRDYIHVSDLAKGHLAALVYAKQNTGSIAVNLGRGEGVSVLELINAFERATGVKVPYVIGDRRKGDLPAFYANADRAKRLFNWKPEKTVEEMCLDSWKYMNSR